MAACPQGQDPVTGLCLEAKQSCPVGGNPIQTGTGDKLHEHTDISATSAAHALSLQRHYRSQNPYWHSGMTAGWNHNWQQRLSLTALTAATPTLVALHLNGTHSRFTRSSTTANAWVSADQSKDVLSEVRDAAGVLTGYQLRRFETDAVETYNTQGVLLSVRERNGWTATLQYSDTSTPASLAPRPGLLLAVRNHFGRELRLTYDSAARLTSATGFDGQTVRYSYDSTGRLTRVTWPDAAFRTYHYEDSRFTYALTGITDELGVRLTTYAYDSEGRAVLTEQAGGVNRVQVSYNADGSRTVTDNSGPNGTSTSRTYRFETVGGVIRPTSVSAPCPLCGSTALNTQYDANGNVTRQVAHNGEVTYTRYDSQGRPVEVATFPASAQSSTTRPALNTALKVVSTRWHGTWNLPTQIAEPGKLTSMSYNAEGSLTGRSERQTTDATGASAFAAVQASGSLLKSLSWSYNSQQLVTGAVEKDNDIVVGSWSYTYNSQGDLNQIRDRLVTTTTASVTTDLAGRPVLLSASNGARASFSWHWRQQMTRAEAAGLTTQWTLDPRGLVTDIRFSDGRWLRYTYNASHKLIQITNESGQSVKYSRAESSPATLARYWKNLQIRSQYWSQRLEKEMVQSLLSEAQASQSAILIPPAIIVGGIMIYESQRQKSNPTGSFLCCGGTRSNDDTGTTNTSDRPSVWRQMWLMLSGNSSGGNSQPTQPLYDKSGNLISPRAECLQPPGDCKPDQHKMLQEEVESKCKGIDRACKGGLSRAELLLRLDQNRQCAIARDKINKTCFAGGDKNHRDQAIDGWFAVTKCESWLSRTP